MFADKGEYSAHLLAASTVVDPAAPDNRIRNRAEECEGESPEGRNGKESKS